MIPVSWPSTQVGFGSRLVSVGLPVIPPGSEFAVKLDSIFCETSQQPICIVVISVFAINVRTQLSNIEMGQVLESVSNM